MPELAVAYMPIVPSIKGLKQSLESQMVAPAAAASVNVGRTMGQRLTGGLQTAAKVAGVGVAGVLGTAIVKGFNRLSAIENAEAKLKGLGNSAGVTSQIMDNALAAVKGTAFGMDEAATTAASAVAAGIKPGQQLQSYLGLVGDAATIAGVSMQDMGGVFNKVVTSGKVQGDTFQQMSDMGIPVVQMLAKTMGTSAEQVYKLGSEGKISSDQFLQAMQSMQGAAKQGGQTTTGAWKNLNAALSRFGAALLKGVYPLIGPVFNTLTTWLDKATEGVTPLVEALSVRLGGALKPAGQAVQQFFAHLDFSSWDKFVRSLNAGGAGGAFASIGTSIRQLMPAFKAFGDQLPAMGSAVVKLSGAGLQVLAAVLGYLAAHVDTIIRFMPLIIAGFVAWRVASSGVAGATRMLTAASLAALPAEITRNALRVTAAALERSTARATAANTAAMAGETTATEVNNGAQQIGVLARLRAVAAAVAHRVAVVAAAVAQRGAAAAQWLFNAALSANPIALVIIAITALVGALVWFFTRTQLGRQIWTTCWNGIKAATAAVVNWFQVTALPILHGVLSGIGAVFSWLWHNIVVPVWGGIRAATAAVVTWFQTYVVPVLRGALHVLGTVFSWLWHNVIVPVWNGIKFAIGLAWAGIRIYFQAIGWYLHNVLGPVFHWLYDNVIKPVWNAIKWAISVAWAGIKVVWAAIQWYLHNVLGPVFHWLYDNVIKPVWNAIKWAISVAWAGIKVIWAAIHWYLHNVLGPVFRWLYENIIRPVWDGISRTINAAVRWIRDNVLSPLGHWIQHTFVDAWHRTAEGVGKAWNALRDAVKTPVKFVVDHVINPFINGYNGINDFWSGHNITPFNTKGWSGGGWTGRGDKYDPAGIVHADEFVVNKASRRKFEDKYPGFLSTINETGDLPQSPQKTKEKAQSGGIYAGTVPPHGPSGGVWSNVQAQASRAGRIYIRDTNIDGASTRAAAQAWMGHSALDIRMGSGNGVQSFVNGAQGGWGFYSGNTIQVNEAVVPKNRVRGVLVHEIGHALGLAHTGARDSSSVMDHWMTGGDWPHSGDYQALQDVWGRPGAHAKTYPNPGSDGGGGSSWIVDKVADWVHAHVDGAFTAAENTFKGNQFAKMPIGIAHKAVDGVIDGLTAMFGGSDDSSGTATSQSAASWTGTVKDALKHVGLPASDDYVRAWISQIQTESGGNPKAMQHGYVDANTGGNEAAGLVQVAKSTFESMRDRSLPDDRFNPLANLVAGMRWAKSRYGTSGMLAAIGHGHGYAEGGLVTPIPRLYDKGGIIPARSGVQLIDHQRNTPDYVLTDSEWKLAKRSIDMAGSGHGGPQIGTLNVQGYTADEVAAAIDKRTREREALYAVA